ncbi:calcium-binding protein [Phytohabitans rumicis]|uniref:Calcium-binding protein n=1 Tax=Phytohabitans rumicis TaxID=1076125 RepID=A0A6V8LJG7_9ACTN|nr:calcium-binding protein [Phytohabitans rumicis]GFJ95071.1 hypothetical protein Prum_087130 [Phytohabitans rumicis]
MTQWTRLALAGSLGTLVGLVVPAAAGAQPEPTPNQAYWEDDSHLRYYGGIGKNNDVVITNYGSPSAYLIDDVSRIVPGYGCVNVSGDNTKAICTKPESGIAWFGVQLGGGTDQLDYNASFDTYAYIYGGTGNDTIEIGSGAGPYLDVDLGPGNDSLQRPVGTAYLRVDGGTGADTMCAGAWVFYDQHTEGVYVTIGGAAGGDGAPDEGDTVCASVWGVTGTAYADTLIAGSAKTSLTGGGGADLLIGGPLNDSLWGYGGNDLLYGLGGNDLLHGSEGTDSLYGGTGTDQCATDGADALHDCEEIY